MSGFSILAALSSFLLPTPALNDATRRALERTVAMVDQRLVNARRLERTLGGALKYAQAYCDGLVEALPGPLAIERRAFAGDPLVHALFATGNDIEQMLGKSQAVRDYLDEAASYESSHFHAMLAARRVEKKQLGSAVQGETIQHDVPQTVLYFADHTLTEPAPSLEGTLARLRASSFDSLLKTFRSHLDELRGEREDLRADLAAERGLLTVLKGRGDGAGSEVGTRRIASLDAQLRRIGDALTPDAVASALAFFLAAPDASLRLEPCAIAVDRMGIVATGERAASDDVARLQFPELISRDRRRYFVTLARIDCAEARRAVQEARDAQRRYLLI